MAIKCIGLSSEHTIYDPKNKCIIDDYITNDDMKKRGYVYVGYAWFNTSGEWDKTEIPVTFQVSNKGDFVVKDPCWNWIKRERTAEQQQWIEDNWEQIEEAFAKEI